MDGELSADGGVIGTYRYIQYSDPTDAFRPYDPRLPEVASRVIRLIQERSPGAVVEHVGSSAIPGCDGKGVVDLMLLYEQGGLDDARQVLDAMGFQRHTGPNAHPEDRPVRIGSIEHDGETFRLHVHVISASAAEAIDQIHFRDTLRSEPELVAEYVRIKRRVLEQGVRDSNEYNDGKDPFIRRVMALGR